MVSLVAIPQISWLVNITAEKKMIINLCVTNCYGYCIIVIYIDRYDYSFFNMGVREREEGEVNGQLLLLLWIKKPRKDINGKWTFELNRDGRF